MEHIFVGCQLGQDLGEDDIVHFLIKVCVLERTFIDVPVHLVDKTELVDLKSITGKPLCGDVVTDHGPD